MHNGLATVPFSFPKYLKEEQEEILKRTSNLNKGCEVKLSLAPPSFSLSLLATWLLALS